MDLPGISDAPLYGSDDQPGVEYYRLPLEREHLSVITLINMHRNIEDLTWMAITAPHEMNGDTNRTKALIQSIPGYPELFLEAFGSEDSHRKEHGKGHCPVCQDPDLLLIQSSTGS